MVLKSVHDVVALLGPHAEDDPQVAPLGLHADALDVIRGLGSLFIMVRSRIRRDLGVARVRGRGGRDRHDGQGEREEA